MIVASPVSAAIVTYTVTGTVQYGFDNANLFGSGAILTGEVFKVVETFDSSKASFTFDQANQSGANGGSSSQAPGFASVSVFIGTGSTSFGDYSSTIYSLAGGQTNENVQSGQGGEYDYVGFNLNAPDIRADFLQPVTINDFTNWAGSNFQHFDAGGHIVTYANFDVSRLVVASGGLASVPLPGSLPLFSAALLALGAVGAVVKRRASAAA